MGIFKLSKMWTQQHKPNVSDQAVQAVGTYGPSTHICLKQVHEFHRFQSVYFENSRKVNNPQGHIRNTAQIKKHQQER